MDELDMRIFRAMMTERAVAPSDTQVNSSLRSIAKRVGADDMTVYYRYKRLRATGILSGWQLMVNPTFFGRRMLDVTVDVQSESAKPDMVRKLKLIHEVIGIFDLYGKALKLQVMINGAESRARVIELISRITNPERLVQVQAVLPQCKTERLSETDVAIIRALSKDARKTFVRVSKEIGLSTTTIRNRVVRLRDENTVIAMPMLNLSHIPGLIPVYLTYSYSKEGNKANVDRAMLSHFETKYFWGMFTDPDIGYILLSASTMREVQDDLDWAKSQLGVASARADVVIGTQMFPEKLIELLKQGTEKSHIRKAYF